MDENQQIQPAPPTGLQQRAGAVVQDLLARLRTMEGERRLWLLGVGALTLFLFRRHSLVRHAHGLEGALCRP